MRFSWTIPLAVLLLTGCSPSTPRPVAPWLRDADKPRDENYHGGNIVMLTRYDANKDGTVTRDELIAGLKAEFAAHDVKHNGCLDPDQAADINQKRVEADQSTATPVVDWNQDGCIDYTEFSAAPYSLFDQLDRDHDGKLTPKEMGVKPKTDDDDKPDASPKEIGDHVPGEGGHGGRGGRNHQGQ
jgi:Ca2+-binding EF-hand superfamily protein